jgi:hypothetical protein
MWVGAGISWVSLFAASYTTKVDFYAELMRMY